MGEAGCTLQHIRWEGLRVLRGFWHRVRLVKPTAQQKQTPEPLKTVGPFGWGRRKKAVHKLELCQFRKAKVLGPELEVPVTRMRPLKFLVQVRRL